MDDGSIIECDALTLSGDTSGDKVLYMGNAAFINCLGDISIDNFGVQGPSGTSFKAITVPIVLLPMAWQAPTCSTMWS